MSDRPLQQIQDTVRLPWYQEESYDDSNDPTSGGQMVVNMIPQYNTDDSSQSRKQILVKRPGIQLTSSFDFMTGIVNSVTQSTVVAAITISALYDVHVVAVHDKSNGIYYIIMVRPSVGTAVKIGVVNTGTAVNIDDYLFLSEITQVSAGNLLPGLAISYTNKQLTTSFGYYAVSSGGVFTLNSLAHITDVNFPPNQTPALITIGKFVSMNGVNYIASLDGRIWNSTTNGNDISSWSNSTGQVGFISTNMYPDQCIGLSRYKHHIVAFGRTSIEFFVDVGNTPSPLNRTEQAFINFGAKSPRLFKNINDVLYWVSYSKDGSAGVWMLEQYTPVKISSSSQDRSLVNLGTSSESTMFNMQALSFNNRQHLLINGVPSVSTSLASAGAPFPTGVNGGTDTYQVGIANNYIPNGLCYNIVDKTWWYAQFRASSLFGLVSSGVEFSLPSSQLNVNYYSQILLYQYNNSLGGSHKSQQYIYQMSDSFGTTITQDDVGDAVDTDFPNLPVMSLAQTNFLWFDTEKRKRVNRFKIIESVDNTNNSDVTTQYLYFAKDWNTYNFSNFSPRISNFRGFSLDFPDVNNNIPNRWYLNNLGTGRAWQFCAAEISKHAIRMHAMEIDITQGTH